MNIVRSSFREHQTLRRYLTATAAVAGTLAATALVNSQLARRAERHNPPEGQFITVDGVRLHYFQSGSGEPLVLFHGNGSMIQDLVSSELVAKVEKKYRVIVFDRPGFGHSSRPRDVAWTAGAQADLFYKALLQLGIARALIFGHSWGASVAMALALRRSEMVKGLILASGYYYPTARADVAFLAGPAVPVIGDVMSYTLSPIASRLLWPRIKRKLFDPQPAPRKFDSVPKEMIFRPSQLRASAAETALTIPDAAAAAGHYSELTMPVSIIAGEEDQIIDIDEQSARLHRDIPHSKFHRLQGAGHMIHQTETDAVAFAIDAAGGGDRAARESGLAIAEGGVARIPVAPLPPPHQVITRRR